MFLPIPTSAGDWFEFVGELSHLPHTSVHVLKEPVLSTVAQKELDLGHPFLRIFHSPLLASSAFKNVLFAA